MSLPEDQTTSDKALPIPPLPPRSNSPPLPPRKNRLGLPPSYVDHLRALLHQWLSQQVAPDDGLPGRRNTERRRLWEGAKLAAVEKAIWEGIVCPNSDCGAGGRGLLKLDWTTWAEGSARRKSAYRKEVEDGRNTMQTAPQPGTAEASDVGPERPRRKLVRRSTADNVPSTVRGRKPPITAAPETPQREPGSRATSRAPSVISTKDHSKPSEDQSAPMQATRSKPSKNSDSGTDLEELQEDWARRIAAMKGFHSLEVSKQDEWEILENDFAGPSERTPSLPGSFPQGGGHYESVRVPDPKANSKRTATVLPAVATTSESAVPPLLKTVFCLHIPSSPSLHRSNTNASTSTLRRRRDSSVGARSQESLGSTSGRGWFSGGSLLRGSDMTIGPSSFGEGLRMDFVEGCFALPNHHHNHTRPRGSHGSLRSRRNRNIAEQSDTADDGASAEVDAVEDALDEASSVWSGTQREHSALRDPSGCSSILVGQEDDFPLEDDRCRGIGLVGGTIVTRGLSREEDKKALEDILALLIYTISSMMLELELLDAFRIPREPDSLPEVQRSHTDYQLRPKSPNPGMQRSKSSRDKHGPRSFLRRLGKGDILGGLLGRRRDSVESDTDLSGAAATANPSRSLGEAFSASPRHTDALMNASPNLFNPGTPNPNSVDRHLAVLEAMETLRLSTTPGLRIPMPPLLMKMREQQKIRLDKAQQELQGENRPQSEGLPLRVGLTPPPSDTSNRDILRGRALGHRLGGDVRAGLGALPPWLDTFEGWSKLQRLDLLSCTGIEEQQPDGAVRYALCGPPKQSTLQFWDIHEDKTLLQLINETQEDDDDVAGCTRSGCAVLPREHVRWWLHGDKRITMRSHQIEKDSAGPELDVWVRCSVCSRQSQARRLSNLAGDFSLGKFFELFLYSTRLRPPDLCQHNVSRISIFLRSSTRVLLFSVEDVDILNTRLPKLQVGPNVAKRKGGTEAAHAVIDTLQRPETKDTLLEGLQTEAGAFYASLQRRVATLREQGVFASSGEQEAKEKTLSAASNEISVEPSQASNELEALEVVVEQAKAVYKEQLALLNPATLNDGRQRLIEDVRKFSEQLEAWEKRHACDFDGSEAPLALPEYCGAKVHALPGSAVLVREDEPSSLIAYTLSSLSYFVELASQSPSPGEEILPASRTNLHGSSEGNGGGWTIEIKRRDSPRDLLSLRTITKKRSEVSVAPSSLKTPMSLTTTAPVLEVSKEHGEGHAHQRENLSDLVKSISKATANDPVLTMKARSPSMSMSENESSPVPSRVTTPAPPKLGAVGRIASDSSPRTYRRVTGESAPPSAFRSTHAPPSTVSTPITGQLGPSQTPATAGTGKDGWTSSVTSSFTNSFTHLMKLGSDVTEAMGSVSQKMRGGERSLSSLIGPLNMMSNMDNSLSTFDDRPHIQFTYTLGDKLKLGCTVYYATAFDSLRRRCAIDKSIINSLARSETWLAEGGKSKACFFKTRDGKYIVKELVSKWNVSDTQALLEISPAYFEHLASTHNKATSLAKIVGFYTVRFQDLQTSTKKQLDLLVMENLFYKQTIEKTYDLKGIEGRKLTKTMGPGTTLWDAEWLEKQHSDPILLYPHAKRALLEAISNDTRFLSSQSIIDYSLLLGLDTSKSELVVGVVDAIGSYNLFKTIESRGKQALNRGGDVTILPPEQYRERFETALRQYFLVCPDKWSRPRCKLSPTLPSPL